MYLKCDGNVLDSGKYTARVTKYMFHIFTSFACRHYNMLTVSQKISCCFRVYDTAVKLSDSLFRATQKIFMSELLQYYKYFVSEANEGI